MTDTRARVLTRRRLLVAAALAGATIAAVDRPDDAGVPEGMASVRLINVPAKDSVVVDGVATSGVVDGVITITVTPGEHEIAVGERRWRVMLRAGDLDVIDAIDLGAQVCLSPIRSTPRGGCCGAPGQEG